MLLKIHPENPENRHIRRVVETLNKGGTIIFPTDTVYAAGASVYKPAAFDKLISLKGIKKKEAQFSFIFNNLSMLSGFTKPLSNDIYRLMKRNLPGPFTFILNANNNVPKIFQTKKKTIGIRIPDNIILNEIVEQLDRPLLSTSIYDSDEIVEYTSDPMLIELSFENKVDIVIDGGFGGNIASTVVDCTSDVPEIIRQGKGELIE
ncbi:MAG: threonylcarbamoyl-AMP synthase [Marinilabiliales bacterium]|nr:MAG: threonylcarbamoyl-AMP synthase [Marinilabiliales bacterium]